MGSTHLFRFAARGANAASADEWVATARRAEELGYSALARVRPLPRPRRAQHGDPGLAAVPAMAVAAAVTTDLRVGCRVFCVDFHVPAVLAKEAATIELLSNGRLELGLGAGWVVGEYEALGIHVRRRRHPHRPPHRDDRPRQGLVLRRSIDIDGDHIHVAGLPRQPATGAAAAPRS